MPLGDARRPAGRALDAAAFARRMARLGPFEPGPRLAVAVSGGPDSMALALLADDWARARGGRITALTVDHRLRPESGREARQVARWLAARGIAHAILVRRGRRPGTGVQQAARSARYGLLEGWCAARGVLHLLLAHHRDDQAETVLLRRAAGSGEAGLAAMAAIVERGQVRVLRPLLDVPRARLAAVLTAAGQPFVEDPGNRDPAFARSRLRLDDAVAAAGGAAALAAAARRAGRERARHNRAAARLAARTVEIHPAGFVVLDLGLLSGAPPAAVATMLAGTLAAVAGRAWPPRTARLDRLIAALAGGRLEAARTLAGCRIVPLAGSGGRRAVVVRESSAMSAPLALRAGAATVWDGRFAATAAAGAAGGLVVGAAASDAADARADLPAPARPVAPLVRRRGKPVGRDVATLLWAPPKAVSGAPFGIV
ncbi:MAG: tRNA lysidine(34) synthetase TilS [Alphaproteobacteria bacterium]|nr:tRNA lysidine(34) synthetase TilS [Alphaproteobacteria bacterium]